MVSKCTTVSNEPALSMVSWRKLTFALLPEILKMPTISYAVEETDDQLHLCKEVSQRKKPLAESKWAARRSMTVGTPVLVSANLVKGAPNIFVFW